MRLKGIIIGGAAIAIAGGAFVGIGAALADQSGSTNTTSNTSDTSQTAVDSTPTPQATESAAPVTTSTPIPSAPPVADPAPAPSPSSSSAAPDPTPSATQTPIFEPPAAPPVKTGIPSGGTPTDVPGTPFADVRSCASHALTSSLGVVTCN